MAHFSLDSSNEASQLSLDWGDSGLIATVDNGNINAEFRRFKPQILKALFPFGENIKGFLTGQIHFGPDQKLIAANLDLDEMGIEMPLGSIDRMQGRLSYHDSLGAKWEISCSKGFARGKSFPLSCVGRTFLKAAGLNRKFVSIRRGGKLAVTEFGILSVTSFKLNKSLYFRSSGYVLFA